MHATQNIRQITLNISLSISLLARLSGLLEEKKKRQRGPLKHTQLCETQAN